MSSSRTISVSVCALCSYAFRSVAGIAVYVGLYRTWSLDVADDGAGGVVHELNTDLGNTSTGTCKYVRTVVLGEYSSTHRADAYFVVLCIPVRPKTRVTLTSLTGTLEVSILANSVEQSSVSISTDSSSPGKRT